MSIPHVGSPHIAPATASSLATTSSPDTTSLEAEVTELVRQALRIQARLSQMTRRRKIRSSDAVSRRESETLRDELKRLQQLNEQKERAIELEVRARKDIVRKLANSRSVIRDLLEEEWTRVSLNHSPGSDARRGSRNQQVEVRENVSATSPLQRAFQREEHKREDSEATPATSDSTIKARAANRASPSKALRSPHVNLNLRGLPIRTVDLAQIRPVNPETSVDARSEPKSSASNVNTPRTSPRPATPRASKDDSPTLYSLRYTKIPLSAILVLGPLTLTSLQKNGIIAESTIARITSLGQDSYIGLRLQIFENMAFIYEPKTLENLEDKTTCFVDWNYAEVQEETRENFRKLPKGPLHTFVYPIREKSRGWMYIGAHTWTLEEIREPSWQGLSTEEKVKLAEHLHQRCGKRLSQDQIAEMLDADKLQPLPIRIRSAANMQMTESFAYQLGFQKAPEDEQPPSGRQLWRFARDA